MSKKLGGTLFVRNGLMYDYCTEEAVASLQALCDEVVVLDAGSDDGTDDLVRTFEDEKTKVICLPKEEWFKQHGRYKLAYFTNLAMAALSTEWHINLQADEVIDEKSFFAIREAIEQPEAEGYFVRRVNLWGDSKHELNVGYDRLPVGKEIIRLAKTGYLSIDDAQSINAPAEWNYLNRIKFYHMGFVRSKFKHTHKVKQMLEDIFLMGNDAKVEAMNGVFDPWVHFSKQDIKPIQEELPVFVQEWAKERDIINDFKIKQ
jgi:glycosyltransferase involved in cell wall biosynthesis